MGAMLGVRHALKVFNAVVAPILVNVVHVVFGCNGSVGVGPDRAMEVKRSPWD